jgi:hypothetical protein
VKTLGERTWEQRWAFAPIGLLLACVAGLATMASIAADDPSFSLEPRYYEKAVHWDERQVAKAASERLGWRLRAELEPARGGATLVVALDGADGLPLTGARVKTEAFANARARDIRHLDLEERKPGEYSAALDQARAGLWEFRFEVVRGADRYSTVARSNVTRSEP